MILLPFLLSAQPALAGSWPPGAPIPNAIVADVTPEGFDAIAQLVPAFLPSEIELSSMSGESGAPDWCLGVRYGVSNMWVGIQVTNAELTPGNGVLDLTASLLININNSSDPFNVDYEIACIGGDCGVWVTPFPVDVHTTIGLAVVTDETGRHLDATIGAMDISYALSGSNLDSGDCGTILDIADTLGLIDLIIDQLDSTLQDQVSSLGPTIESTLEDAFAAATIDQDLDLNGAVAHISLSPSAVDISPDGVRVTMEGAVSADPAECVAAFDPGGSLATNTSPPTIGVAPAGVDSPFHIGIGVSDDFANSAIYALWRGGLLCYSLEPGGVFPLDTSILNLLTGDVFAPLFPEAQSVVLRTQPREVPEVDYAGSHDVEVGLRALGLEMFAEVDGRQARVIDIELDGPVGIDLALDGSTGNLGINVDINPDNLIPTVAYNEFYPDQDATIADAFQGSVSGLLDTLIGGLLGDLAFALPAFSGLGLQELDIAPAGSNQDWLGAYARIGAVTYGSGKDGCGGCGGDSSGCSGGCATGPGGIPNVAFGLLPLGLALLLRRRE